MDQVTLVKLDQLREEVGFPLPVTSGYRCESHNEDIGGAEKSPHKEGYAVDIQISGGRAWQLLRAALLMPFTGIGVSQRGPMSRRFIHLDLAPSDPYRPRPRVWSY